MGPTLVAYLRGAGVGVVGTVEATTVTAATGMAGALWLAAAAVVGVAAVATTGAVAAAVVGRGIVTVAVGSAPGLDRLAGGRRGAAHPSLKLCPPRVLTMLGLEKGRRWREWEEEDLKWK